MAGPVVMATGHRDTPEAVLGELERVLARLEPSVAISGGAAGADRLFAQAAVTVGVPLHLMLPNRWYRTYYPGAVPDRIVDAAAQVTFVVDRPADVDNMRYLWDKEKWWKDNYTRNEAMVVASELTVVVSPHHPNRLLGYVRSGTAGTVRDVLRQRGERHRVLWVPSDGTAAELTRWVPLRVQYAVGDWSDFATG